MFIVSYAREKVNEKRAFLFLSRDLSKSRARRVPLAKRTVLGFEGLFYNNVDDAAGNDDLLNDRLALNGLSHLFVGTDEREDRILV